MKAIFAVITPLENTSPIERFTIQQAKIWS